MREFEGDGARSEHGESRGNAGEFGNGLIRRYIGKEPTSPPNTPDHPQSDRTLDQHHAPTQPRLEHRAERYHAAVAMTA